MIARIAVAVGIKRKFDSIGSQRGRSRDIAEYLECQYGCTGRHTDANYTRNTQSTGYASDMATMAIDIERVGIGDRRAERRIAGIIYRPGKVETTDDLRSRKRTRLYDIRIVSGVVRRIS